MSRDQFPSRVLGPRLRATRRVARHDGNRAGDLRARNEPWARVLARWIDEEPDAAGEWHRAGDLAEELEECADEHDLPIDVTSAAGLGSKLATYHNELAELYDLEIEDGGRSNRYRFVTDEAGHNPAGLEKYY